MPGRFRRKAGPRCTVPEVNRGEEPAPWRPQIGIRSLLIGATVALVVGGMFLGETAADPERLRPIGETAALREIQTMVLARVAHPIRASFSGVLEPRRSVRLFGETRGSVIQAGAEDLDHHRRKPLSAHPRP